DGDWDKRCILHIPHNAWVGEVQWRSETLEELGLDRVSTFLSTKRLSYSNTGTWSSHELLPMGCFENPDSKESLLWQIETNGSWHWEISTIAGHLYLQLSGPTQNENHWYKNLGSNEKFISVPVSLAVVKGSFEKANEEMTKYRRSIRRANMDNEALPVIFNDYMNCLFADPTTEKSLPLIDSAVDAGCEYYCIDAGWYADGLWWDEVGEWLPSEKRFPGGIKEPLDYIRSRGMIPGMWLEVEVVGIHCAIAQEMPDDWFFMRHGKRIIDHSRYQLDFRNKDVVSHASSIIDRLVGEYGVGYIKMDYNINAGIGTDLYADSPGDGLLEHNRAYLKWIDSIFVKYPNLIIENCASGGMRMDYAMLSRLSIQSITDQTDYRKNAVIAAAAPSAATPEQCAIWSYPLKDKDEEEVIFNMVNAMLMRIHQSGHLAELSPERFHLVKLGIACYKSIRDSIKNSTPFWPLGLPCFSSQWLCLGLKNDENAYLAVWKLETEDSSIRIPLNRNLAHVGSVKCIYPDNECCEYNWADDSGTLEIKIQGKYIARLFELKYEKSKEEK
ncbi:MAG: glycoside hydrolase family 36 protein, partial [Saccharofermentanales bacterium]